MDGFAGYRWGHRVVVPAPANANDSVQDGQNTNDSTKFLGITRPYRVSTGPNRSDGEMRTVMLRDDQVMRAVRVC
jgi:hypothetical protein